MDSIIDTKDKRILYQLETNSRQPLAYLAKNVGLSREVVDYRVKLLEKKGIIESYLTTIDFVRLGLIFCRTFYRYNHVSSDIEQHMVEYARKDPYVAWMALGDGDMNLAIVYIVNNLNLLEKHYYDFLLSFGNYFKNNLFSIAFKIYHFKHTYLYHIEDRIPLIVGTNKDAIIIDETDYKLMLILMKDPRINIIDLAKQLKLSTKTANNRMKSLIENKIILGFRIKINTRKLNMEHHKVFLYLEDMTKEKLNMLISYLSHAKEIIFITLPMGNAHLEFEVIVEGKIQLFEFMRNLALNFPDLIREYESALIYSEPFTNYIPILSNQKGI